MKKRISAWLLAFVMVLSLLPTTAFAADEDEPTTGEGTEQTTPAPNPTKSVTANADGSYTISLSVTGESDENQPKANVVVVIDVSTSMSFRTGNQTGYYAELSSYYNGYVYYLIDEGYKFYGKVGEDYFELTYRIANGSVNYYYEENGEEKLYENNTFYYWATGNETRIDAAKRAVNSLAKKVLEKNGESGTGVKIALVSFGNTATIVQDATTDPNTIKSAIDGLRIYENVGTNWEAGLAKAQEVEFNNLGADTYVIFVSDGDPTYRGTGSTPQGNGSDDRNGHNYAAAVAEATAMVNAGYKLYTIGAYGNVDKMEQLKTDSKAAGYYRADNTTALEDAFDDILKKIEQGIADAQMTDGLPNGMGATEASAGVDLLTVDTDSFKYYRNGTEDATLPAATYENNAVNWNLESLGVLENGVTYTVKFKVYPTQETLDMIAALKNGEKYEDVVPEAARSYLDKNGNLKTNTTATLSYDDTRTPKAETPVAFNDVPAVEVKAAEKLSVTKVWQGVDTADQTPITLKVKNEENTVVYTAELKEGEWSKEFFISRGIMTGTTVRAAGHDFTIEETVPAEANAYRWEIDAPTYHPMLINGVATMLIKVDATHPAPDGATTYTIDDDEKYYAANDANALTVTNTRRSNLNLTKVVEGTGAPADAEFTFTLTVTDPENENIWFSVRDADNHDVTKEGVVTDATKNVSDKDGSISWWMASGATATLKIQNGWNVRVFNLLTGTTYKITETAQDNFEVESVVLTPDGSADADATDPAAEPAEPANSFEGKITAPNTTYTVTFTNKYTAPAPTTGKLTITKTFKDLPTDLITEDVLKAISIKVEAAAAEGETGSETGTAAGTTETAQPITVTLDKSVKGEDGSTYTLEIKELPFGEYTVTEEAGEAATKIVKDEKTKYILDATTLAPTDGKANVTAGETAEVKITNTYAIDKIGGGPNGDEPDTIPDKYQVTLVYKASPEKGGKVDPKKVVKTLKDGDNYVTEGEVTAESTATANTDYTFKNWTGNGKNSTETKLNHTFDAKGGETYIYTATFTKKDTPKPPVYPTVPLPPVLNTKDHFAYIIGSDDGLVRPNANITRAEVATIFFRMLTDESRNNLWTHHFNENKVILKRLIQV